MPDTLIHTWVTATFEPPKWVFPTMFTPTLTQPNPSGDAREYKEAIGETAITRHARGGTVPTPRHHTLVDCAAKGAAHTPQVAHSTRPIGQHERTANDELRSENESSSNSTLSGVVGG